MANFLRFSAKSVLNIMPRKAYSSVIATINESNNEIKNWYMWFRKKISRNIIARLKGRLFFLNIDMILTGSQWIGCLTYRLFRMITAINIIDSVNMN
ncbi:hypothetical protein SN35N_1231 [Lactiplantibacillus plantarum]|nr:hypothetical protein SN35N_1231 [Lactiplantibacillus plantarum]